jgi:transglutaminase-like putative cysteine protease
MIQPPPFLLALGLLLWGGVSGQLTLAAAAALVVEAPRLLPHRFDLTAKDFERAADLSTLALSATAILLFARSRHFSTALLQVLGWLPLLFLPLVIAQRYSTAGRMPLSALVLSLRRRGEPLRWWTVDYAYFGACLIAASAANVQAHWYFAAVVLLGIYALWPAAPRGHRLGWAAAAGTAALIGFGVQAGLSTAQSAVQELVFQWLEHSWRTRADPYQAQTAIGDLGVLKGSDRILMRLASEGTPPQLLRAASYTHYGVGTWSAVPAALPFRPLTPDDRGWSIAEGTGRTVRMSTWLDEGSAVLALPLGTYRLEGLSVARAERNALGTLRVEQGPETLSFMVRVDTATRTDAGPGAADLTVPPTLRSALEAVSQEIGLTRGEPALRLKAIVHFFATRFAYSLNLEDGRGAGRSLRQFLLEDRRGHCEYFATATVLLLRHAGIPARYATGFSVQEFSQLEQQYVVRARHAHAWAMVWIDGQWQALDTTPAQWAQEEEATASPLQPAYDLLSWLYYRLAVWSAQEAGDAGPSAGLIWLVPPLALYLGWQRYRRRRVRVSRTGCAGGHTSTAQREPNVQAVLDRLAARGFVRPPQRALLGWVQELPLADPHMLALLVGLIRDYYRIRFDPQPAPDTAHATLEADARRLLALLSKSVRSQG